MAYDLRTEDRQAIDDRFFIATNAHGRYAVPKAFASREVPGILAKGDIYEPETIVLLQSLLGEGDIVTGGAFVGDFFPALCAALAPDALLHSFEPMPLTFDAAQQTIALNDLTQVRLHQVAVSDKPGSLPLQITRRGTDGQLAAGARIACGETGDHVIDVPVTTIDSLVPEDRVVSVLHLDVEGHEIQALNGAVRVIRSHAPAIVLEGSNRPEILRFKRLLRKIAPDQRYVMSAALENNALFLPFEVDQKR